MKQSTVVILATDNEPTRYLLNQLCVETQTPFVVGKVFTRGIGGETFAYRPEEGGCLACLESRLERSQFRDGIREIDLVSDEEREKLYGMEISEIKDSPGLNVRYRVHHLFSYTVCTRCHRANTSGAAQAFAAHRPELSRLG